MRALDLPNYKVTGEIDSPENLDYDILGLQKKRTITKGELVKIEYYRTYDGISYNDLIVDETRIYNKDALGITQTRDVTINWYLEDDTIGCSKSWRKYYSPDEAINEGITRRNNMIAAAKIVLLAELKNLFGEPTNQSYAFDLLTSVKEEMRYFTEGYTPPLRAAITASTKPYLTAGIKTAVVTELTF